jgi:SAM-dependent methyltransferase
MSITRHLAELLLAEHKYRPIDGDVLLLGRQMVFMTPDEAQAVIERMGVRLRTGVSIEFDRTSHGRERNFISDVSFFSLFADADVRASDVSDYEGADLIFDLSGELPAEALGAYNFIYNGSVLDNVFDPAACLKNISRMLKSDGVCFGYEGLAHSGPAYLKFGPEWFFDYYAVNDFTDAQFYCCAFDHVHRSAWTTYQWDAFVPDGNDLRWTASMPVPGEAVVIAIAQKSATSTNDRVPLQNLYRPDQRPYQAAFRRFETNPRRAAIATSLRAPIVKKSTLWRLVSRHLPEKTVPGHKLVGMLGEENSAQVF